MCIVDEWALVRSRFPAQRPRISPSMQASHCTCRPSSKLATKQSCSESTAGRLCSHPRRGCASKGPRCRDGVAPRQSMARVNCVVRGARQTAVRIRVAIAAGLPSKPHSALNPTLSILLGARFKRSRIRGGKRCCPAGCSCTEVARGGKEKLPVVATPILAWCTSSKRSYSASSRRSYRTSSLAPPLGQAVFPPHDFPLVPIAQVTTDSQ